jgi:hypothetical protein
VWFPWPFNLIQGWLEALFSNVCSVPYAAAQWLWGSVYPQFDNTRGHVTTTSTWVSNIVQSGFNFSNNFMQNLINWLWGENANQFYILQSLVNAQFAGLPPLLNYGNQWIVNQFGQRFDLFGGMMQGWLEALLGGFGGAMGSGFLGGFQWLFGTLLGLPGTLLGFFNVNNVNAYAYNLAGLQSLGEQWTMLAVQQLLQSIFNIQAKSTEDALSSIQNVIRAVVRGSQTLGALNVAAELLHPLKNASFEHLFGHEGWTGVAIGTLESLVAPLIDYLYEVTIMPLVRSAIPGMIPPEAILEQMAVKGIIDPISYTNLMLTKGYNAFSASLMLLNAAKALDPDTIITLLRRGEIDTNTAYQKLRANMFTLEDAGLQLKLQDIIPNVQDLITFVVREVITPEDFTMWAEKQGLNKFWSGCYWEAHWRLPSVETVVDAFHRGVITAEELSKYLVWHDYKPTPRPGISVTDIDIFRATQKTLFTRVDARYAYEFGFWDFDRLVKHFQDLGYEDDALDQALVQVGRTLTEEKGKLETQAINDYTAGYISAEQLEVDLKALGLSPDRVEMRLQLANRKFEAEFKADLIKIYCTQYQNDLIDEADLDSALAEFIINDLVRWAIVEREKARKYPKKR